MPTERVALRHDAYCSGLEGPPVRLPVTRLVKDRTRSGITPELVMQVRTDGAGFGSNQGGPNHPAGCSNLFAVGVKGHTGRSVIETVRLVLRELTADDLDALMAVLGAPVAMRHYPSAIRGELKARSQD